MESLVGGMITVIIEKYESDSKSKTRILNKPESSDCWDYDEGSQKMFLQKSQFSRKSGF